MFIARASEKKLAMAQRRLSSPFHDTSMILNVRRNANSEPHRDLTIRTFSTSTKCCEVTIVCYSNRDIACTIHPI